MDKWEHDMNFELLLDCIENASISEVYRIVEEIRICHDNLCVYNAKTKALRSVTSVCLNGESIQLNVEES